jgi:hypothetical protein
MRLNTTTISSEIAVLLAFLVALEWLAHVLTDTGNLFVPTLLTLRACCLL